MTETIQRITGIPLSGRPAKSTSSIIEKLNRESIRLSQMQDIAGAEQWLPISWSKTGPSEPSQRRLKA